MSSIIEPGNNSQYSLQSIDNYKLTLPHTSNDILSKYNLLVQDYLNIITENISVTNNVFNNFIIIRGLEIITNVFTIILFYSKNIDMAFYHGQKAFYFYVEFIGQISEVQHTFLQLSSRDAVMFVYKKTIFEINNEIRKKHKVSIETNGYSTKLDILDANIDIMKNIIIYIFASYNIGKENATPTSVVSGVPSLQKENIKDCLKKTIKRLEKISDKINNPKITIDIIRNIQLFVCSLNIDGISIDIYCDNIEQFIKRCIKESPTESKIKSKMVDVNYVKNASEGSDKFIAWIFSNK